MALIQYAAPWDRQPQEAGRLADAYSDAVIAWLPHDLTGNGGNLGRFTHQGALTHSVTPSGLAYHSSDYAANNRLTGRTLNPATLNWPGVTVVARLTAAALPTSSYPAVVSWLPEGEYYGGFNLSVETSDVGRTFIYWRAGNNTAAITPTGYYDLQPSSDEYALGDKLTIVAGWDGATTWIVLNRNGVIYSHSSAHTGGWRNLDSLVALLGYERSGYRTSTHEVGGVAVFPRDLRASAMDLVQNPWQIFAPQTIWVPVSAGGGTVTLAAQDAAHAHALDNAALSIGVTLTVADLAHGHALDASTLSTGTALAVADAQHAHALDNVTLSTTGATSLTVADLLHAHTLDAVVLTSQTDLAVADVLHAHALDGVTLDTDSTLAAADLAHAHALDAVVLGTEVALAVADALHAHALDGVTLTLGGIDLVIAGVMHAHALDTLALTLDTYLAIADALHAHALDNADLSLDTYLVVADALHAHAIDNLTLSFPATGALSDAEFRQMYDWLYALSQKQLLTVGTFLALK